MFGYDDPEDALNPRLLAAIVENGGRAIVRDSSGVLLGFCYGFPGRTWGRDVPLLAGHRRHRRVPGGVGRILKSAQRDVARRRGADRIRWVFDPALVANAHFNLDVLGASGRWCVDDLYGLPEPSPRMIGEWEFDAPPRRSPTPPPATACIPGADGLVSLGFDPADGGAALVERLSPLFARRLRGRVVRARGTIRMVRLRARRLTSPASGRPPEGTVHDPAARRSACAPAAPRLD